MPTASYVSLNECVDVMKQSFQVHMLFKFMYSLCPIALCGVLQIQ